MLLRAALAAIAVVCGSIAAAQVPVPPVARVTDLTGTLSSAQQAELTQRLAEFEAKKGAQVAVLIVPTTAPETIEQYALRVAETWQLGRKGIDDGALLVIAKNDRRMRIEVGYGLEGILPDAVAKRIIAETIAPRFRDGDWYGGIRAGIEQMLATIEGEPLPAPKFSALQEDDGDLLAILLAIPLLIGHGLRRLFGALPAALLMGALAAVVVWVASGIVLLSSIVGLVTFALVLGGVAGRVSSLGGGRWGGGGYAGGGFRGGGGRFGGGGASGSW
ncbi:uncharacterized protein SAMN04488120_11731 [Fontimonas thermophila]|uniref:TPM domain-containing protein n=1 Tax=Fontimonas thermophila TaxID=1076937 RepID=A0A1I2KJ72_9GAMM|nr:YgcG family protein [Fontimonas thermophila]SFF65141.1 uncharacterized protein SAMN04488120_11731 [Fontimonas thermophila]